MCAEYEENSPRCDDPELGKRRSKTVEKALRATNYIQVIPKRKIKHPTMVCRKTNKCLEIISRSIVEQK